MSTLLLGLMIGCSAADEEPPSAPAVVPAAEQAAESVTGEVVFSRKLSPTAELSFVRLPTGEIAVDLEADLDNDVEVADAFARVTNDSTAAAIVKLLAPEVAVPTSISDVDIYLQEDFPSLASPKLTRASTPKESEATLS